MGEPRSMETSYVEKICDSRLAMTRNLSSGPRSRHDQPPPTVAGPRTMLRW